MADPNPEGGAITERGSDSGIGTRGMEIPPEKAYYLQRTQVLEELKEEIGSWAKQRFWVLAIAIAVVGLISITAIVRETVRGVIDGEIRGQVLGLLDKRAATHPVSRSQRAFWGIPT